MGGGSRELREVCLRPASPSASDGARGGETGVAFLTNGGGSGGATGRFFLGSAIGGGRVGTEMEAPLGELVAWLADGTPALIDGSAVRGRDAPGVSELPRAACGAGVGVTTSGAGEALRAAPCAGFSPLPVAASPPGVVAAACESAADVSCVPPLRTPRSTDSCSVTTGPGAGSIGVSARTAPAGKGFS